MKEFPFPDKENSMQELLRDYVYPKIEPQAVGMIFEEAWQEGERQGRGFLEAYEGREPLVWLDILRENGVKIQIENKDYVLGNRRYFCEYLSGRNQLKIYKGSVELWCESNGLSYEDGLNVILCHEYFHYLEGNKIGMLSRRHQVPVLKLGPLKLGKTGIPSLSEIGANAFAQFIFQQGKLLETREIGGSYEI